MSSRRCALGPELALIASVLLSATAVAQQGNVHETVPERIDPAARYLIYLHGKIIEDEGARPTHPRWGVYEFGQIREALAARGFEVISEQRPPATDMAEFARRVAGQVEELLAGGVPPEGISVVGFSKGGGIAIRTAALLHDPRVNFVLLAACGDGDFSGWDIEVSGRILSIHESSDDVGRSCAELFAKSDPSGAHKEVRIDTGEEHGAFYRPRDEWLAPLLQWLEVRWPQI